MKYARIDSVIDAEVVPVPGDPRWPNFCAWAVERGVRIRVAGRGCFLGLHDQLHEETLQGVHGGEYAFVVGPMLRVLSCEEFHEQFVTVEDWPSDEPF